MQAPKRKAFTSPTQHVGAQVDGRLPFGVDFQGMFLRIVLVDRAFARVVGPHVQPHFFQNDAMAWMWGLAKQYADHYGSWPTFSWIADQAHQLPAGQREIYGTVVHQVWGAQVTDEAWLRDAAVDFVRRSIFRQAHHDSKDLYVAGRYDEAYDLMMSRLETIKVTHARSEDRGWYAEEFGARFAARQSDAGRSLIPIGVPQIDALLGGGAYEGFLGTWLAYPKHGKSTWLVNIGATCVRSYFRKVLHVVLEGKRQMVEARYDAVFTDELYSLVKKGDIDEKKYHAAHQEMQYLRGLLVIRGFVDDWETNALQIEEELRTLEQQYGWSPEVLVVDYADLMRARPSVNAQTETQHQVHAYKDLKSLVGRRGLRGWTASQVQRPDTEDFDTNPTLLRSKNIADAYGKVRICDLIGSLNQTVAERQQGVMRIFVEMLRDGPANVTVPVHASFDKMSFGTAIAAINTAQPMAAMQGIKPFGGPAINGYAQILNGI